MRRTSDDHRNFLAWTENQGQAVRVRLARMGLRMGSCVSKHDSSLSMPCCALRSQWKCGGERSITADEPIR